MQDRLFGTDGIRGRAGKFPLDAKTVFRVGAALVRMLRASRDRETQIRIVSGRDTRESGPWIEAALAHGVSSEGATLVSMGVAPTPAVALTAKFDDFDAGVVVSASHNLYEDNGIKVFSPDGLKLPEHKERDLEELVESANDEVAENSENVAIDSSFLNAYIAHVRGVLPDRLDFGQTRLAIDCANGAMYELAPKLLRGCGFDVMVSGCAPNGKNINTDCGSTHPTTLAKFVVEHQCHVGVAFDGDGDRALFVDAQGGIIDGDTVLFICAKRLNEIGQLPGNAIVATVMSNVGLELGLQGLGIDLVRCQVGDRYVMEEMTKHGIALGGEQSGHIIFSEYLQTGDGLITAMMVLRAMAESGRALADLAADLDVYPQVLVNVPVRRKTDLQSVPEIAAVIRDVEHRLAGQGRLLVRYSGTEPLLRIMVEGRNQVEIQGYSDEIASAVKRCLL